MKLKIRVKKKDLIFFIIVSIALFLVCMILSKNFLSLVNESSFVGLNVFTKMTKNDWILTIILFIISLLVIFMSVSKTIFDFEKGGFGFIFGEKEEKGYNRWCTDDEMKSGFGIKKVNIKDKEFDAAGIVLINDGKRMWVDNGEYHTLVIGQSGSGKTTALVDPQVFTLCQHGESMIISDLKGEIYRHHANRLRAKGYKIIVLNFRDPREGNAWNPLTIPYRMYKQGKTDKAKELLDDISQNIVKDPKNQNDPFWETSAADYFSGLALALFANAKENEVNISSISDMVAAGEEKNGISLFAKDFFSVCDQEDAYNYAKAYLQGADDTRKSILAVLQSKVRTFSTRQELSEMLSYSDFNMEDIGNEKTAVFLIVHDEKTTYHALATIFLKQMYEVLIDVAHKNPNGELKYRTNFILDEFANMPALKDVTSMVTAARSRKIRFTFIIQNFAQLDDTYGDKTSETIRSNCGNTIYLLTNELAALEEISKLCGEVKSKDKEKTVSTPLVTVTDLQKMKRNEIIVIRMRMRPYRTVLKGGYDIDWGDHFEDATLEERDVYPIKKFDLKTFVKEQKRKKTMEAINQAKETQEDKEDFKEMSSFPSPFGKPNFEDDFNPMKRRFEDSVDIDELVKNIDAQIAALEKEEEEARQKEHNNSNQVNEFNQTKENNTEKVKVDNSSVVLDDKVVTDDQYFDDFFGEDE